MCHFVFLCCCRGDCSFLCVLYDFCCLFVVAVVVLVLLLLWLFMFLLLLLLCSFFHIMFYAVIFIVSFVVCGCCLHVIVHCWGTGGGLVLVC